MQKKKSNSSPKRSIRSKDLPATQGMLQLVRSELKADIRGLRSEMKAGFSQINSRFEQIDSRFSQIDSRFSQIDSRFHKIDSRFHQVDSQLEQVLSQIARVGSLVEEQNTRNQVVLEGLTGLFHRQDRSDERLDELHSIVQGLAARSRR